MSAEPAERGRWTDIPLWRFAMFVLTAGAIGMAGFLMWKLRDALVMAFGAVVVAVLLLAFAGLLRRIVPLRQRAAVVAAALLIVLILGGFAWLMGSQVVAQVKELRQTLPLGLEEIENQIGISILGADEPQAGRGGQGAAAPAGGAAGQQPAAGEGAGQASAPGGTTALGSDLWGWVASYGFPVVNAVFGAILVAIAGVFLALRPDTYRRGIVKLFPQPQHARIEETLTDMGRALHFWLGGMLISMAMVGVLTGVGTWLLGLPAPVALGLFAAIAEFVPVVGPIVAAVPAVLMALTEDWTLVIWTVLLYVGIQQLESNMIMPLVQERMVDLPPALFLFAVLAFGGIFGIVGVFFAAPLMVVTYVAVQKLWVRDTLHEETSVPGESGGDRIW